MRKNEVLFRERQRFTQWWLLLFLAAMNGLMVYIVLYQIVGGRPWGDKPMSDTGLLILAGAILLSSLAIFLFRLDTRIDRDGVFVKFIPFHRGFRHFSWDDLRKCYVRRYSPIREFGGWGWRLSVSGSGKAYNVSGNMGLQLEFTNGKKLLIGTRRPEELKDALTKLGTLRE